jgi:F-type H+-transporting ATPase subunit b
MLVLSSPAWANAPEGAEPEGVAHGAAPHAGAAPEGVAHEGAAHEGAEHHGMDWTLVGLQASNFFLFALVVFFAARRPVLDALGNRANAVRRDLDESQQVKAAAQKQYAEIEEKLAGLERRIESMKAESIREAEAEAVRIRQRADADAIRIRETAQRTVREEALRARNELRREVVGQAVGMARELIKSQVNTEDQARLQAEFLGALSTPNGGVA